MTAVPGGRPLPIRSSLSEDCIIHSEQLTCVHEQLTALSEQRQHVIRMLRGLARRPTVGLTPAERARVAQEVTDALARRRAVAEAWGFWWTAYSQLLRDHPSTVP